MRIRTAKTLAQRIDLNYFKRPQRFRRWRTLLSIAAPLVALFWLGSMAAAGNRRPYISGPVSSAHAFTERKCEVCHVRDAGYRAHADDKACLTCHDAPAHPTNAQSVPDCAACHREHNGRVELARTADAFCVGCHANLSTSQRVARVERQVRRFPNAHPQFVAARRGHRDPGTIRFNHEVHLRRELRGPSGPETLACATCHKLELRRTSSRARPAGGLMAPLSYEQHCARCHPLYFDERLERQTPHDEPAIVGPFVRKALAEYIAAHPDDITKPDPPPRRVPLNFPRVPEPPPRTAEEWVARKVVRAETYLWARACAECHLISSPRASDGLPVVAVAAIQKQWMPNATFDHMSHLIVECRSCHAAERSRETGDSLMPPLATCATCHAPRRGAESRCFQCHAYHDWSKAQPVKPAFTLTDFQ